MTDNYLYKPLDEFFKEVSYFNGNIFIVNSLIESRTAQIKSDFVVPQSLWQTATYFRDVTFEPNADNLFPTGYGYDVGTPTLEKQAFRSVSFICCTTIASVYESFDTFLKDVLTQVYMNTEQKAAFKFKETYDSLSSVRANLWQVRSDKGFLKIIRRVALTFARYERKNIYKYDLGNWYNMVDMVRHQIVHRRQQADPDFINELKIKGYWKLFNQNFTISQEYQLIQVSHNQASQILANFIEYAYLVYKSLSQDIGLPYEIDLPTYKQIINLFQASSVPLLELE